MTTCCAKPKPIEMAGDTFQRILGVVVWLEGSIWLFCDRCGTSLSPPLRRTEAPLEDT